MNYVLMTIHHSEDLDSLVFDPFRSHLYDTVSYTHLTLPTTSRV